MGCKKDREILELRNKLRNTSPETLAKACDAPLNAASQLLSYLVAGMMCGFEDDNEDGHEETPGDSCSFS